MLLLNVLNEPSSRIYITFQGNVLFQNLSFTFTISLGEQETLYKISQLYEWRGMTKEVNTL